MPKVQSAREWSFSARMSALLLVMFAAVYVGVRVTQPLGHSAHVAFLDISETLAALLASAFALWAGLRSTGRSKFSWLAIGAGCAVWAFGDAVWTVYEVGLGKETPFPSLADVGYLGAVPLMFVGLLMMASPDRSVARARTALDAVALILAVTALAWESLLLPIYSDSEATLLQKALGGAYPLGDLALFFALLLALNRSGRGRGTVVLGTFALGLGLFLEADVAFAYLTLHDAYSTGSVLDYGWTLGFLTMGLAAVLQAELQVHIAAHETSRVAPVWRQAAPLCLLLVLVLSMLMSAMGVFDDSPMFLLLLIGGIFAIVARQGVVLQDNVTLNDRLLRSGEELEERVNQRTVELREALDLQIRLDERSRRLASILDATPDLVATADLDGNMLYLNSGGRRMIGASDAEDTSTITWHRLFPSWAAEMVTQLAVPAALRDGIWSGETALQGPEGVELPVSQVVLAHQTSGEQAQFISTIARDLTERKRFEAQLSHLANKDPLTGAFNSRRLQEEIAKVLAMSRRSGRPSALLFLDLDNFKYINDSLGHQPGDELLIGIARMIRQQLRETDVLGRVGGDEFAVVLPETDQKSAQEMADRLLKAIRAFRITVGEELVGCTASIGIVVMPDHGNTAEELLMHADLAMYRAKLQRDANCVYSVESDSDSVFTLQRQWEQKLREAIATDALILYAQPIVSLADGAKHYELLLRFRDDDGGIVPPAEFLPIAERSGMIREIDRWVARRAIALLAEWRDLGHDLTFEINLSGKAFGDAKLLPAIRQELQDANVEPSRLIIEITETSAISNLDQAQHFIQELKKIGCRFAVDDFGVGFSSLYYLKHLPVDYLKIDGTFIRNLPNDPVDQHLVKAIVEVARGLGKMAIAEYVQDERTVRLLRTFGVDYVQGYYIGMPLPLDEALSASRSEAA